MASLEPIKELSLQEKLSVVDKVIAATNRKFGKTVMGRIGQSPEIMEKLEIKFIPSASRTFNEAVGGGFPRSRMSIVTGESDSGKTGLLLESIAKNMRTNASFVSGWLESEHSLEKEYIVKTFGIDPNRFVFIPLDNSIGAEGTLDIIEGLLPTNTIDMFVINSLRCLIPDKEKEKSITEETMALQARLNAKLVRRWTALLGSINTALVLVQHLTTAIGNYGDPKVLAGGEAIRYWSALTVDLRKHSIKDSDPITKDEGMKIGVTVKKNHCAPSKNPYVKFDYYVVYGQGVEEIAPSIQIGIEKGVLERHGAWLYWMNNGEEVMKFSSKIDFRNRMKEDPDLWDRYTKQLDGKTDKIESLSDDEMAEIEKEQKSEAIVEKEMNEILTQIESEEVEKVPVKTVKKKGRSKAT